MWMVNFWPGLGSLEYTRGQEWLTTSLSSILEGRRTTKMQALKLKPCVYVSEETSCVCTGWDPDSVSEHFSWPCSHCILNHQEPSLQSGWHVLKSSASLESWFFTCRSWASLRCAYFQGKSQGLLSSIFYPEDFSPQKIEFLKWLFEENSVWFKCHM